MRRVGVRCSRDVCRKRYTFPECWRDYEFSPAAFKCSCGSKKFVEDAWRKTRGTEQRCDCGNYPFPHRKNSQKCEHNALAPFHIARDRYGVEGEQLHLIWLDCVWESEGGRTHDDVPF